MQLDLQLLNMIKGFCIGLCSSAPIGPIAVYVIQQSLSKVGATVGTLVTNPVTIFFIYPAQTWFVNRLLFNGSLSFDRLMQVEWTWEAVRRLGAEAMASFFLGGFLLAIVLTPPTYFIVKRVVTTYRRTREQKRHGTAR